MSAVVCGLDVHKESTYATVLDRDGQVLVRRKMFNEDISRFLEPIHPDKLAMWRQQGRDLPQALGEALTREWVRS